VSKFTCYTPYNTITEQGCMYFKESNSLITSTSFNVSKQPKIFHWCPPIAGKERFLVLDLMKHASSSKIWQMWAQHEREVNSSKKVCTVFMVNMVAKYESDYSQVDIATFRKLQVTQSAPKWTWRIYGGNELMASIRKVTGMRSYHQSSSQKHCKRNMEKSALCSPIFPPKKG
jgi:hypothetical protein